MADRIFDDDEPIPRTASKTLQMDIQRMASIEKEPQPCRLAGHALTAVEKEAILDQLPDRKKVLMYSESLKK